MHRLPFKRLLSVALASFAFGPLTSSLSIAETTSVDSRSVPAPVTELAQMTVGLQTTQQRVYLDARLEAINQSTISAQTSGIVESINVDINDAVSAGQTLIIINNSQQKAGLSQAEANAAQAEAMNEDSQVLLTRNRSLYKKNTLSKGELDSSIARAKSTAAAVLAAKAQVIQAQEQLSYTRIIAPYSGIVSQRMVEVGELVNPGQPLMTGFSAQPLRAITSIPQHLIAKLAINDSSRPNITIKSQGHHFPIDRYTLFPYADSRYSSVQARLNLSTFTMNADSAGLMPGAWVEVAFPIGNKKTMTVPQSAIIQQGEVASLYVIDKNSQALKLRYVHLGANVELMSEGSKKEPITQVEILAGLNVGDMIAINALEAAVKIRANKAAGE